MNEPYLCDHGNPISANNRGEERKGGRVSKGKRDPKFQPSDVMDLAGWHQALKHFRPDLLPAKEEVGGGGLSVPCHRQAFGFLHFCDPPVFAILPCLQQHANTSRQHDNPGSQTR